MESEEQKPKFDPVAKIRAFIASSRRVFVISSKPNSKEFQAMIKATAIGIAVVGVIGYIIYLIFGLLGLK